MQLSWQPGFSLARKPSKRPRARNTGAETGTREAFCFIAESPVGSLPCTPPSGPSRSGHPSNTIDLVNKWPQTSDSMLTAEESPAVPSQLSSSDDASSPYTPTSSDAPAGLTDSHEAEQSSQITTVQSPAAKTTVSKTSASLLGPRTATADNFRKDHGICDTVRDRYMLYPALTPFLHPTVHYNDLQHRFKPVLERYNQEFCKIPLTSDVHANPFQYCRSNESEPEFLIHAVLALAGHHVENDLTHDHRDKSLQLLRNRLGSFDSIQDGSNMLDAIIILFSLDETQSLFGNWKTHLAGAYSVLEASGGYCEVELPTRIGAQIGMLLWWDSIVSLVSREDCVFPSFYCERILTVVDACQWDFFSLCGCPSDIVHVIFQMSRLAAEKTKSLGMRFVKFDDAAVAQLENALDSWNHPSSAECFTDEESMQLDRDRMHCSEAWRNGILLYAYRVFRWTAGEVPPMQITSRARDIVDHILACRDDAMISRQALLPLFFAACETRDHSIRRKVIELCSTWDTRTRYHMFQDTVPLLEEVWSEQERRGFENVWWGQIVDAKHRSNTTSPLQQRICFG